MVFNQSIQVADPIIDLRPRAFVRDPAMVFADGSFHLFFTRVEQADSNIRLFLEKSESRNLRDWSEPERLLDSPLNFSSPGNVIRHGGEWVLCLQSYPINPGELWGSDDSRLWTMRSCDLRNWGEPEVMVADGCGASWAKGAPRQIDPYIVASDDLFYCFYKSCGCYGLLVSDDLRCWREALPDRPAFEYLENGRKISVENPCVIRDGSEFVLFFSLCSSGRGIGVARSSNLRDWHDARRLDLPDLPWAGGGITAAMVLDLRNSHGYWLMAFHGDGSSGGHEGAIGLARSHDLLDWGFDDVIVDTDFGGKDK